MHLYILRHGNASDRALWSGDDRKRPLTVEGREEMRAVAKGIRWLDLKIDTLIASPLTRARETADFVAQALHPPRNETSELLSPGCDLRELGKLLLAYPQAQELMIVGHEPDLSGIIAQLVGADTSAQVQMKKAACCCLKLNAAVGGTSYSMLMGQGMLIWHIPPKILARLG